MENKNLIFGVIVVLVVILCGVGIGYIFFENNNGSNEENNIDNEKLKLLDKYVQSIEGTCTTESTYTKLFNDDLVKISDLSADIQLELITNYFENNIEPVENVTYYEQMWPDENGNAGFYLDSSNITCEKFNGDAPVYESSCYNKSNEPLYKSSDLENLFKNVFGKNSKYYLGITDTQFFPTMHLLKDNNEYFSIVYRGGCGPDTYLDLNYNNYEVSDDRVVLYYSFIYGYYDGNIYTGTMNNLKLLEENIEFEELESIYDKYKNELTQFKFTFLKDNKGNYYYYSIEKA